MTRLFSSAPLMAPAVHPCECGATAVIGKHISDRAPIRKEQDFIQCSACGHTNQTGLRSGEVIGFPSVEDAIIHWNASGHRRPNLPFQAR